MRLILLALLLLNFTFAEELSSAKLERAIKKGEKVAKNLCDTSKLSTITGSFELVSETLTKEKPCGALSAKNQKALAYYLASNQENNQTNNHIDVPKDAKCPVCGMFVHKYPKWSALMVVKGQKHYFDGVKDMMKYYIFDADFPYKREEIEQLKVSDFYTLKEIEAKEAYYVIGSDVFGPMGDELIPFESEEGAKNFMGDHKGDKIVKFDEITDKMVMGLDGF